jgi:hypothetical protein
MNKDDAPMNGTIESWERRSARDQGRLPKPRSKGRPYQCPACGSKRVVPIRYGLPGSVMIWKAKASLIVLGGCCMSDDDPCWACVDCREEIWKEL